MHLQFKAMPNFQELLKSRSSCEAVSLCSGAMFAGRYVTQQKLGCGSFGTVYLVLDKKARNEEFKVLKEISVGDLNPNETVQANLEAQLLSKLDHPAIVKFYASFLEKESFCIITEYCEGQDLDFKIQEYKKAGNMFTESQIVEWFIELLLGVNYMHERRILHRDLKAKNIFLKNNHLKIGDFGVSRLLMGSCDLATTFTGTPYYMSPEALKHQGYDSKSDIWSLACILYEMCCLDHAFTGYNFMSVVFKIVEGETPSLPEKYSSKLSAVMRSMLNKDPSQRPSTEEILKISYINEQLQRLKCKFLDMTLKNKALNCEKEAAQILHAVQKKVHLQTLRELSEVQKMTPRERMRLRKLNAADEKAEKLKRLAEENYQENHKRMQELRCRNFQRQSVDVLHVYEEQTSKHLVQSQPVSARDYKSMGHHEQSENKTPDRLCMSEPVECEIPEDPHIAEEYYNDGFDSCSEASEEEKNEGEEEEQSSQAVDKTFQQDSDAEAMVRYLESVLDLSSPGTRNVTIVAPAMPQGSRTINDTMAESKVKRMREPVLYTWSIWMWK
ncbi:serine/threonine-protein kinase Nek11 isoform X2 [Rhinatrema bivittatum]|uniref:serine/threonine-protein kinase Nek11 isoform X2 n=1 Tax=Rhinatrema bivittatum TaxID=194408 RepID=UPI00112839BE|nr:serine/threonine-protein kinase Nek11 isoform X2 [Rhinatrema bivittatum]